jgi:hypothetical protein
MGEYLPLNLADPVNGCQHSHAPRRPPFNRRCSGVQAIVLTGKVPLHHPGVNGTRARRCLPSAPLRSRSRAPRRPHTQARRRLRAAGSSAHGAGGRFWTQFPCRWRRRSNAPTSRARSSSGLPRRCHTCGCRRKRARSSLWLLAPNPPPGTRVSRHDRSLPSAIVSPLRCGHCRRAAQRRVCRLTTPTTSPGLRSQPAARLGAHRG